MLLHMRTGKLLNMLQLLDVKRSKDLQLKMDQDVLTAGHDRTVRSESYEEPWSESCDFILVGDLMGGCSVPDLGDQGIEFGHCMPAWQCNNAASLLEHPWFTWSLRLCDTALLNFMKGSSNSVWWEQDIFPTLSDENKPSSLHCTVYAWSLYLYHYCVLFWTPRSRQMLLEIWMLS